MTKTYCNAFPSMFKFNVIWENRKLNSSVCASVPQGFNLQISQIQARMCLRLWETLFKKPVLRERNLVVCLLRKTNHAMQVHRVSQESCIIDGEGRMVRPSYSGVHFCAAKLQSHLIKCSDEF